MVVVVAVLPLAVKVCEAPLFIVTDDDGDMLGVVIVVDDVTFCAIFAVVTSYGLAFDPVFAVVFLATPLARLM